MTVPGRSRALTLEDIDDLRAYERGRAEYRRRIIELKARRRVTVGPIVSFVFENRETVRSQVQEMARAERILTDEGIQAELDVYNPLIPGRGELSATLFVELTSREEMERWLPRLVGVERAVVLRLGPPGAATEVRCTPDPEHEAQLTREAVTAAVHYVRFRMTPREVEAFSAGPVRLAIDHPAYQEETELSEATRRSLLDDLLGAAE